MEAFEKHEQKRIKERIIENNLEDAYLVYVLIGKGNVIKIGCSKGGVHERYRKFREHWVIIEEVLGFFPVKTMHYEKLIHRYLESLGFRKFPGRNDGKEYYRKTPKVIKEVEKLFSMKYRQSKIINLVVNKNDFDYKAGELKCYFKGKMVPNK